VFQESNMKLISTRTSDTALSTGALVLRLGAGLLMIVDFGYMKLTHFSEMAPKFINPFHIGSSATLGLVVFAEFFCSIFVVLGLFTRLACIPLIINFLYAFVVAHKWDYGAPPTGGMAAVLFLTCFVTLLFTGPGKISLDRLIGK
jgi:putative oxidoreductase